MGLPLVRFVTLLAVLAGGCGGTSGSAGAVPEPVASSAALRSSAGAPAVFRVISGSPGVTWIVLGPLPEIGRHDQRPWQWTERAPDSYVQFDTAAAPALPRPRTFTMVGAGPPCVVTTAETSYLRASAEGSFRVIEVAPSTCALGAIVAVEGEDAEPGLRSPTAQEYASAPIVRWTEQVTGSRLDEGFGDTGPGAWVEAIPGTDVEVVLADLAVATPPLRFRSVLLLRHHGELFARFAGPELDVLGQLTWAGEDYLIAHDRTRAWAVPVP